MDLRICGCGSGGRKLTNPQFLQVRYDIELRILEYDLEDQLQDAPAMAVMSETVNSVNVRAHITSFPFSHTHLLLLSIAVLQRGKESSDR